MADPLSPSPPEDTSAGSRREPSSSSVTRSEPTRTAIHVIPCPDLHTADEWALVLRSQNIPTRISYQEDTCTLAVNACDLGRALGILEQYRAENLRRPWQHTLPRLGIVFHAGVLFWALWMIAVFASTASPRSPIRLAGLMDAAQVAQGEWWRLFTAVSLHADLRHLAANLTTGIIIYGLVMARLSAGCSLLAGFCAGALGNLFAIAWHGWSHRNLGASGMVMGGVGLLCANAFALWFHARLTPRHALTVLASGTFLFLLWGIDPDSDIAAHFGGFIAGLMGGTALELLLPNPEQRQNWSPWAGLACILLLIATWSAALN